MAKKKSSSPQKKAQDDVIEVDLKELLTPGIILVTNLLIAILLIIGLNNINNTLKKFDNFTGEVKSAEETNKDNEEEAEAPTKSLSNGDALSTQVSENVPNIGQDSAKVAIVEYGDYACGYCGRHAEQTLGEIKSNFIDTGDVKYYFKSFPIFTPLNSTGAQCAYSIGGSDKFLEFHNALFAVDQVTGEESQIVDVAKSVGLDEGTFTSCLNGDEASAAVDEDRTEATNLGLGGTPGFIVGTLNDDGSVDGEFVAGAQPYSVFEETIKKYL